MHENVFFNITKYEKVPFIRFFYLNIIIIFF